MTVEKSVIGIRREDKNKWEKRVPLVPVDAGKLARENGLKIVVQPSMDHRAFNDADYAVNGVEINEDLAACDVICGVKEIPASEFLENKGYIFFSHVIKGQPYNMPMLQRMLDQGCTLIDYEKIEDENGRRLIFFGRYAGLAGMVETLNSLGLRLKAEGIDNPFLAIKQPCKYASLKEIKKAVAAVGEEIRMNGLPEGLSPFVCGFTGYGNVSIGAQEIFDLLPVEEIDPETIRNGLENLPKVNDRLFKVVFKEEHMFAPKDENKEFELSHYFNNPGEYKSKFSDFHHKLTLLVNCIYWTEDCPYLLKKADVEAMYADGKQPRLRVIGDISCDIEGSVEVTVKATDLDNPMFVYEAETGKVLPGVEGHGPVVMSIENLPCEIPVEASQDFSGVLAGFLPGIAAADLRSDFDDLDLEPAIKGAVITHKGKLTPHYQYISEFLAK